MLEDKSKTLAKSLIGFAVCFCATAMIAARTHAAFHLWNITEVYSNASGTLQFIELVGTSNSQHQFSNAPAKTLAVSNVGGTLTNTFTMPLQNLSSSATSGRSLLFGTAGLAAAGGPTPDFIIPNNFLFTAGGSINYFGQLDGAYTALPTDGSQSRIWDGVGNNTNNAVNSPRNFAGTTGVVNGVPEPGSIGLLLLATASICGMSRRRRERLAA